MKVKLINIADAESVSIPAEITPEEEAALLAQYKASRTPEALAADPMLVKRLRRLRASRQKARAARRLGFEVT